MLTGADLKAFRELAGVSDTKMAHSVQLSMEQFQKFEQSHQIELGRLHIRWLWICTIYAVPNFLLKLVNPLFLTRAANEQVINRWQQKAPPGILLLLSLLPFYFIYLISSYYFAVPSYMAYSYVYCMLCLLVWVINRGSANISSILALLLLARLLEIAIIPFFPQEAAYQQYYFSALYLALDSLMVIALTLRPALFRWLEYKILGSYDPDRFKVTQADLLLINIYLFYILIGVIMTVEYVLRHLDHIGLPYNQWLYENVRWFWYSYEYIKGFFNILEFVALLTTINWRLSRYQA